MKMFYYKQNEEKALDGKKNNTVRIREVNEDNYENRNDSTESEIEDLENEELETDRLETEESK